MEEHLKRATRQQLLDLISARIEAWHRERPRETNIGIQEHRLTVAGRVLKSLVRLENGFKEHVREYWRIYQDVFNKSGNSELLLPEVLDMVEAAIVRTGVNWLTSLRDYNQREGAASGEATLLPEAFDEVEVRLRDYAMVSTKEMRALAAIVLSEREMKCIPNPSQMDNAAEALARGVQSRKEHVTSFLRECNQVSNIPVRKLHIWKAAGHMKSRQFEYWQSGNSRATVADGRNFSRLLSMPPHEFVALLIRKGLLVHK